jgi:antitoxin component HigA of HigAB toxin-antitoxin module
MNILTDQDHQEALERIGELMDIQPEVEPNSPEGQELNTLVEAVIAFENIHYPI